MRVVGGPWSQLLRLSAGPADEGVRRSMKHASAPSAIDSGARKRIKLSAMTGAESLIGSLIAGGVDTCFANPGTSEIHLVAALDHAPQMRCVLGLFEGVVSGAADGYARMAEKPACTLLHLGPGLGNGIANLHNASRAQCRL